MPMPPPGSTQSRATNPKDDSWHRPCARSLRAHHRHDTTSVAQTKYYYHHDMSHPAIAPLRAAALCTITGALHWWSSSIVPAPGKISRVSRIVANAYYLAVFVVGCALAAVSITVKILGPGSVSLPVGLATYAMDDARTGYAMVDFCITTCMAMNTANFVHNAILALLTYRAPTGPPMDTPAAPPSPVVGWRADLRPGISRPSSQPKPSSRSRSPSPYRRETRSRSPSPAPATARAASHPPRADTPGELPPKA